MAKLRIKKHAGVAVVIHRLAVREKKLVYALLSNKPLKYRFGRSRVAYIGTTSRGIRRTLESVAERAADILALHGVKSIEVQILTCHRRSGVATWKKLERAIILEFRSRFGEVPKGNSQFKKARERDEFHYFQRTRVRNVVTSLG